MDRTKTSPYADFSATWNYVERSGITFGVKHARNATDKSRIIGFTKKWGTPVATQNVQCLSCHSGGVSSVPLATAR